VAGWGLGQERGCNLNDHKPFFFFISFRELFLSFPCLIHQRHKKQADEHRQEEVMKTWLLLFAFLLVGIPSVSSAAVGDAVEVSIVTDNGHSIPFYPHRSSHGLKKVYAEAVKGDHYRIVVRNNLNRRVGVVVAVDGRNIISGQKSWLKNNERMYILEPWAVNEYSGWRTGQERVNRFYFTDVPDSYAAAFGDQSAMGVIALAVYPEIQRYKKPSDLSTTAPGAPQADAKEKASPSARGEASQSAGTGYGREEYSPSRQVSFEPEGRTVETILVKYEWRATLCRMNVIHCGTTYGRTHNRLWDNHGYVPPPPVRP
jgi:hypothetical protein